MRKTIIWLLCSLALTALLLIIYDLTCTWGFGEVAVDMLAIGDAFFISILLCFPGRKDEAQ